MAGGLLGRVASGFVAAQGGWRAAFLLSAAVTAAGAAGMGSSCRGRFARAPWRGALGGMVRHLGDRRLLGGFTLAFCLFFAFIAVFTYLPYRLAAPPFQLSTDAIASAYLVYVVGIAASPLAGRLAVRVAPERIMLAGLAISAAGVAVTLSGVARLVLAIGLLVLVVGMFTAQAIGPSYVNETAKGRPRAAPARSTWPSTTWGGRSGPGCPGWPGSAGAGPASPGRASSPSARRRWPSSCSAAGCRPVRLLQGT